MPHEERTRERGIIGLQEVPKEEAEGLHHDEEDNEDDVRDRRVEVAEELAFEDRANPRAEADGQQDDHDRPQQVGKITKEFQKSLHDKKEDVEAEKRSRPDKAA